MIEKRISLGCGNLQQIAENTEFVTLPKIWLRNKEIKKVDQIEMFLTESGGSFFDSGCRRWSGVNGNQCRNATALDRTARPAERENRKREGEDERKWRNKEKINDEPPNAYASPSSVLAARQPNIGVHCLKSFQFRIADARYAIETNYLWLITLYLSLKSTISKSLRDRVQSLPTLFLTKSVSPIPYLSKSR